MIIYTITHRDSGKCYVGQTTGTTKEREGRKLYFKKLKELPNG